MRAIIFINFRRFGIELIEHLINGGIIPVLLNSITPDQLPNNCKVDGCIFQNSHDMCLGKFPEALALKGEKPITPDPEMLALLANCERIVLPMMERLNYFNLRTIKLIELYRQYVANWLGIFHALKPEVIIFQGTPHEGFDFVVYSLAQFFNIITLIPERTIFKDRFFILKNIHAFPEFPSDFNSDQEIDTELLDKYHISQTNMIKSEQINIIRLIKSILSAILHIPRLTRRNFDSVFALCEKAPMYWQQKLYMILEARKASRLKRWYSKKSCKPDLKPPYVYFPLNVQPERSTIPMGKDYWDHCYVLNILLDTLPEGWKIYIKEHPRQFSRAILKFSLARDRDFYEKLSKDKRVVFMDLEIDSKTLIKSSKCIATISGTAGWEAITQGTPCLIFGSPWYKECPEVVKAKNANSCRHFFKKLEQGELSVNLNNVKNYAVWVKDKVSYIGSLNPLLITSLTQSENAYHIADSIIKSLKIDY